VLNVVNTSLDPHFNLALEEYLLQQDGLAEDVLIVWQNSPTVVVGRHQDTLSEIDYDFVRDRGINVVRRLSGGGAVYHDLGNLNFSFIKLNRAAAPTDFAALAAPVIATLHSLEVDARHTGRNDLTIDGRKFSGNAQYYYQDRLLHHGTLLFATDFAVLERCLSTDSSKYAAKAVRSVQSRVTNIVAHLPAGLDLDRFKALLIDNVFRQARCGYREYGLTPQDKRAVEAIAARRYRTWEWNFGRSPAANFSRKHTFPGGTLAVFLDVDTGGLIKAARITGDFFAAGDIAALEIALVGLRHQPDVLAGEIARLNPGQNYFRQISDAEFLCCLI
jgi:lipoate-protein ligase A